MKLIEALKTLQSPLPDGAQSLRVYLACGFTPLHLQTYLAAHLRRLMPGHASEIKTGLFGDLAGNIERLNPSEFDVVAVVLEWADLDPRLGIRQLGGWRHHQISDILISAESTGERLNRALAPISRHVKVVLSLPTLPLPPAFATRPLHSAPEQLKLYRIMYQLAETLTDQVGIQIINPLYLSDASAASSRYDVKSDLLSGFPYTLPHASAVGEHMARLIGIRPAMKGLITDLDDTMWSGIVGEDGVDGISWNLDGHSQIHGVYQQFLASLASSGVLIGIASKNDPAVVEQVWRRKDLLLSREDVFPLEIHWMRKSDSVRRILSTWNISADATVFVDDSPAEVAEVQASFPELVCRVFPRNDTAAAWALLHELRDLFGKSSVSEEDSIRLRSIREAVVWRQESGGSGAPSEEFLRSAEARICFDSGRTDDPRAFELVNKTNQFNLNGKRYTESEWRQLLEDPSAFLTTATYDDKYGTLGKVAALTGTIRGRTVDLKSWVMSCRAFSRRIEHQCIRHLFEESGADLIRFDLVATERNGPIQDFFRSLSASPPGGIVELTKEDFFAKMPQLFHRVEVSTHA